MIQNRNTIYFNADAGSDASASTDSGGSGSGGSIAGLVAQGLTMIAGLIISRKNAKEQRELQERLALLSLEQQKELEMHLHQVQGEVAKMALLYQALNMQKNREATIIMNKQKYVGIAIIGAGIIVLSLVIYKIKKHGK